MRVTLIYDLPNSTFEQTFDTALAMLAALPTTVPWGRFERSIHLVEAIVQKREV